MCQGTSCGGKIKIGKEHPFGKIRDGECPNGCGMLYPIEKPIPITELGSDDFEMVLPEDFDPNVELEPKLSAICLTCGFALFLEIVPKRMFLKEGQVTEFSILKPFFELMLKEAQRHDPEYGDSWLTQDEVTVELGLGAGRLNRSMEDHLDNRLEGATAQYFDKAHKGYKDLTQLDDIALLCAFRRLREKAKSEELFESRISNFSNKELIDEIQRYERSANTAYEHGDAAGAARDMSYARLLRKAYRLREARKDE